MAEIKPNSVIRVPAQDNDFFRNWLDFLSPFHNLTDRETEVAAAFLKERYALSKVISDSALLDRILMGEDTQRKLKEACKLTNQHFQVIKSKLKAKGFFVDNKIQSKLIPPIKDGTNSFQLLLLFEVNV